MIEVLDNPLTPELLALARWMSDYYLYPLGQTIEALVPRAVSRAKPKKKRYLQIGAGDHDMEAVRGPKQRTLLLLLCDRQVIGMEELKDFSPATIKSLCDAAMATIIERESHEHPEVRELRHLGAERAEERDVLGRVGEVVVAPEDVRDAHVDVVHADGEVVERVAVGAHEDEVVQGVGRELDAARG